MKKTILVASIIVTAFAVSGCMTNETVSDLPQNMRLSSPDAYGKQFIDSVTFTYPGRHGAEKRVERCVLMNISNNSVVLNSSTPHIGHIGRRSVYYSTDTSVAVPGGRVLQYVDEVNGEVIAAGRTDATPTVLGMPLPQVLNFKAHVVAPNNKSIRITFSELSNATTSGVGDTSFHRSGAWKRSDPIALYNAIKRVSDNVARCL